MLSTLIILIILFLIAKRIVLWHWNKTRQQRMYKKAISLCKD